ncbi:PREDICTED: polycomb group RING finger protein 1-like [Amphimedon queenslandica]|uniref:RING-type domain-containing protein n=1 Tax=Amphimedon queenslandica TaxID=400682 RepID=A0A1X7UXZ4_AMPQE|nr:PREDICTED: polycomb group RING finger protein 1-like [Amphimedon queenslandica]|eukprot:XP_019851698.1 PREDICTED: polycomb group RING finger protein 1-like [Amphimedon queenslandica]
MQQNSVMVKDINQHITCSLCAGYLIDATTIIECLHTFCKTCIVKYLQNCNSCPVCNTVVHETQPLLNIRPDRTMQDIVYKLVPSLYNAEQKRREEFYRERGEEDPNVQPPPPDHIGAATEFSLSHYSRDDDLISLQIESHSSNSQYELNLQDLSRKYYRCSSRVTVFHLKKFILGKIVVPPLYDIDLLCCEKTLHKDNTLKFIWISYWLKRDPPLVLKYKLKQRIG